MFIPSIFILIYICLLMFSSKEFIMDQIISILLCLLILGVVLVWVRMRRKVASRFRFLLKIVAIILLYLVVLLGPGALRAMWGWLVQ